MFIASTFNIVASVMVLCHTYVGYQAPCENCLTIVLYEKYSKPILHVLYRTVHSNLTCCTLPHNTHTHTYIHTHQRRSDNRAPLRHYFYIPRPRSHINLYIEYDFNYMKGAQRRTDVVPPLHTHTHSHSSCNLTCIVSYSIFLS